jgi:acyl-coenzyme A synthetase/AMP-(fatty) acid ligase
VDQFPQTATGKIQKFILRERVEKGELVPIGVERAPEGVTLRP